MKISVVEASQDVDIAMMALMAKRKNNRQHSQGRSMSIDQDGTTTFVDADSDDDFEMTGQSMKEAFTHYHKVYNEDNGGT